MQEEILNIDFNVRRMVLKALNRFTIQKDAAKALGISDRTLIKYKEHYNIVRDTSGTYISKQQTLYHANAAN
jgi:hypothetical protein